jgi:hypothetical protein
VCVWRQWWLSRGRRRFRLDWSLYQTATRSGCVTRGLHGVVHKQPIALRRPVTISSETSAPICNHLRRRLQSTITRPLSNPHVARPAMLAHDATFELLRLDSIGRSQTSADASQITLLVTTWPGLMPVVSWRRGGYGGWAAYLGAEITSHLASQNATYGHCDHNR